MTYVLGLLLAFFAGGALATWIFILLSYVKPRRPSSAPDDNVRTIRPGRVETY